MVTGRDRLVTEPNRSSSEQDRPRADILPPVAPHGAARPNRLPPALGPATALVDRPAAVGVARRRRVARLVQPRRLLGGQVQTGRAEVVLELLERAGAED